MFLNLIRLGKNGKKRGKNIAILLQRKKWLKNLSVVMKAQLMVMDQINLLKDKFCRFSYHSKAYKTTIQQ